MKYHLGRPHWNNQFLSTRLNTENVAFVLALDDKAPQRCTVVQ